MPTPTGNSQATIEVGLLLGPGHENLAALTANSACQEAVFTSRLDAWAGLEATFVTNNVGYVDQLLKTVNLTSTPQALIRFGLASNQAASWTPWQRHLITGFSAVPQSTGSQAGYCLRLKTADTLRLIHRQNSKLAARQGTVSEMMLAIAAEHQLEASVEPTTARLSLIQSYESDLDFITRRLLPRAVNKHGQGNFHLYILDNVIHFHSPGYQAELLALSYYQQSTGLELVQEDRAQHALLEGAGGVKMIAHNPLLGELGELKADPSLSLTLGNIAPALAEIALSDLTRPWHVGLNQAAEAQAMAQAALDTARARTYVISLDATKTTDIKLGDLLDLTIAPGPSQASPWSGPYHVAAVRHAFMKGDLRSNFILQRGELLAPRETGEVKDVEGNSEKTSTTARGKPLNVRELARSKTRGPFSPRVKEVQNA